MCCDFENDVDKYALYVYNQHMNTSRPVWSTQTKLVIVLLLLAGMIFLLNQFRIVIAPLVLAVILAFILTPLVNSIHRRVKIHRVLVIIFVYLVLFLIIAGFLTGVIPLLVNQVSNLEVNSQELLDQAQQFLGNEFEFAGMTFDGQELLTTVLDTLQGLFQPVVGHTLDIVTGVFTSLAWIVFIFVISFYLVKDGEALSNWVEGLVPPTYKQDFIRIKREINLIWSAFFRGQLMLALTVMVIITVMGLVIGLPFALAMGVLAGLLEFIPSFGHGIWLTSASILAFIRGSTWIPMPNWSFVLLLVGLTMIFQQFDINYLIPRMIGRRVHLPPLVVILGIFTGAAFAGVLGVVLAAPTISSLRVLGRYVYALLFDMEPFPETVTTAKLPPPDLMWWLKYRERFERRIGKDKD
jgi:predicted PurR-regulated permease PerM